MFLHMAQAYPGGLPAHRAEQQRRAAEASRAQSIRKSRAR
jgi:hypothetical protein